MKFPPSLLLPPLLFFPPLTLSSLEMMMSQLRPKPPPRMPPLTNSESAFFNKELVTNAKMVKLPQFITPDPLPPMALFSIPPSQEVSQSASNSEFTESSSAGTKPSSNSPQEPRLTSLAHHPSPTEIERSQRSQLAPPSSSTSRL